MSLASETENRAVVALSRRDYELYGPLVRRMAIAVGRKVPAQVAVSELVAHGWLGLMAAFQRAGDMPEGEFEEYASYRIRGAVLDFVRSLDPAAKAARALSRRIAAAMRECGGEPEVARELGMTVDELRDALERVAEAGMARLEMLDFDRQEQVHGSEEHTAPGLGEAVADAIHRLPEPLAQVLALHCQEECTFAEIGDILGVTERRARQMHSEAIHRVRALIGRT